MKWQSKENGPVVITFDNDNRKITQELPWDATADDILHAVYTSMIGMTFTSDGIIAAMEEFVESNKNTDISNNYD